MARQTGVTLPARYYNVETGETITGTARTGAWFRTINLLAQWTREKRIESATIDYWRTMLWAYLTAATMGLAGADFDPTPESVQEFLYKWDVTLGSEQEDEGPLVGLTD